MTNLNNKLLFLFFGLLGFGACNPDAPQENTSVKTEVAEAPRTVETPKERIETIDSKVDSTIAIAEKAAEKPIAISDKSDKSEKEKTPEKEKPSKRPKISFASTTYDYGVIMQGDKVEHSFKFTNKGNADLIIKNVTASCGCTQPSYPFIPIAPGEEGVIGVVFDSKGKLGRQKPTVTVTTNASTGTYKLNLEGFVDAERAKEKSLPETETPNSENLPEEGGSF